MQYRQTTFLIPADKFTHVHQVDLSTGICKAIPPLLSSPTFHEQYDLLANAAESPTLALFKQQDRLVANAHARTFFVIGVILLMEVYRLMNIYRCT